jgi:DNA-binding NtrC family response regulator
LSLQAKLLRVLEDGAVPARPARVASHKVDALRVRRDQPRSGPRRWRPGGFRSDLLFRLNAVEITLPPLRNRREDIPYLTAASSPTARDGSRSR